MAAPQNEEQLERFVDAVLRAHPPRHAPSSLEARVLQEIRAGAHRAWWQRSFAHWPRLAQLLFLPLCCACALIALSGLSRIASTTAALAPAPARFGALARALLGTGATAWRSAPPHWLQDTLVLCVILYALLFALCAIAYRFLYLDRQIIHEPTSI